MPRDAPVTSTALPPEWTPSPPSLIAGSYERHAPGRPAASLRPVPGQDIDLAALRSERLGRLQDAMRAHGADVCLFFNQANVRYATGTAAMTVYANGAFVRCALVPAEGAPILFEHPKLLYRVRDVVGDVRPMPAWEFGDDPDGDAQ